ncbi:hypothetical protein K7432_005388 [Basidiobolus ranarum]|uniref:Pectate lyase superfamily protein domain-containing protein n=1 Tax=Basidiobolus ranarum TaxID=34480 RepID=A0ABR2WWJ9_9FUNG
MTYDYANISRKRRFHWSDIFCIWFRCCDSKPIVKRCCQVGVVLAFLFMLKAVSYGHWRCSDSFWCSAIFPPKYPVPHQTLQPSGNAGQTNLLSVDTNTNIIDYKAFTDQGDIIPDYSYVGYYNGEKEIPEDIPVVETLDPSNGDDTTRIQEAIQKIAALPIDGKTNYRGALFLSSGIFTVSKVINIGASGIVIRGDKAGNTTIVSTFKDRQYTFNVDTKARFVVNRRSQTAIMQKYVALGATKVQVTSKDSRKFVAGDTIVIARYGNWDWIHEIGMDTLSWHDPNDRNSYDWRPFELYSTRKVQEVNNDEGTITFDAPLTTSINQKWGGGWVAKYSYPDRLEHVGVEYLNGVSTYDASVVKKLENGDTYLADMNHALGFVLIKNCVNCWVRTVTGRHFDYFITTQSSLQVTVQDCTYSEPVSPIDGGYRYAYYMAAGSERILYKQCRATDARHPFIVGSQITGPNVFHDCESTRDIATSEPHMRWSVGGLFDQVKSTIAVQYRGYMGSGHGWSGANYMLWNCEGSAIVQKPPTAQNFAVGHVGEKLKPAFQGKQDGWYEGTGKHVEPASLYQQQLKARLQKK